MGYLVSIILLFVGIIEYAKHRIWAAPSVIFPLFWSAISMLASLRLFNLNSVAIKIWIIILVGTLSFVLGTKIKFVVHKDGPVKAEVGNSTFISPKVFWILFFIIGAYLAYESIRTFQLLQQGYQMSLIRDASFGGVEIEGYVYKRSALAGLLRIALSVIQMLLVCCGIEFYLHDIKMNRRYIIASICLVLGKAISAGGRWALLYFVVEFFVCRRLIRYRKADTNKLVISTKVSKNIILTTTVLILIVYVLFWISSERGVENLGRHFYVYLCGCVPLLDLKVADVDKMGIYSFVYAGQYGLWSYVIPFVRRFAGIEFPLFRKTVDYIMTGQQVRNIGPGTFNAFTTCFYYLYADFRYFGVILGMLVFGIISGNVFRFAKSRNSSHALVVYLLVCQMFVTTVQVYPFTSAENVGVFVAIAVIYIISKHRCRLYAISRSH